jgi:transmembrane sensor
MRAVDTELETTELLEAQDATSAVLLPIDDARVQRAWDEAQRRLEQRRRHARRAPVVGGGVAIAALAAAAWLAVISSDPAVTPMVGSAEGARPPIALVTDRESGSATTADGSRLFAHPNTQLRELAPRPPEQVFQLVEGHAAFRVTHDEHRSFVVWAHGVRVLVVGTRFDVRLLEEGGHAVAVRVRVREGHVQVTAPGHATVSLFGGDVRTFPIDSRRPDTRERAAASVEPPRPPPTAAALDGHASRSGRRDAARRSTAEGRPHAVGDAPPNTAIALFEQARSAQASGDLAEAVVLYERLLARHPRDIRASLAAFELGRVRMDRLGDLRAAARDFDRARRLSPRSPLSDDATARLVRIHERLGQTAECQRYRRIYLQRFATGRHRGEVEGRCR